jgi:hypothetical protein
VKDYIDDNALTTLLIEESNEKLKIEKLKEEYIKEQYKKQTGEEVGYVVKQINVNPLDKIIGDDIYSSSKKFKNFRKRIIKEDYPDLDYRNNLGSDIEDNIESLYEIEKGEPIEWTKKSVQESIYDSVDDRGILTPDKKFKDFRINFIEVNRNDMKEKFKCNVPSNELGKYYIDVVDNLLKRNNFNNYTYKDDFKSEAYYFFIRYWWKFRPEKVNKESNKGLVGGFSYFTTMAWTGFREVIKKEQVKANDINKRVNVLNKFVMAGNGLEAVIESDFI